MQEVTFCIRFTTPCLGNVRAQEVDKLNRDTEGNIIFMPSWWQRVIVSAANAINLAQGLVRQISWDIVVYRARKQVTIFDRSYTERKGSDFVHGSARHEALLVGAAVWINVLLPDGIPLDNFRSLLEAAGRYYGISPFGHRLGFGRFEVLNVKRGRTVVATDGDD